MFNAPTNVVTAFERLLEEIEAQIDFANSAGIDGFQSQDYDRIKEVLERVKKMTIFRDEVDKLRREWTELFIQDEEKVPEAHAKRRNLGRLKHGETTPNEAYKLPILEALESLGSSAKTNEVYELVLQRMKGVLRDLDYERLDSGPLRWQVSARWARNWMVKEGLLRNDSPHGVWQISEAGKRFLSDASSTDSAHDQTKTESTMSQNDLIQEGYHDAPRFDPIRSDKEDMRQWAMGIIEKGGLLPVDQFIERIEGASPDKVYEIKAADTLSSETKAEMKRIRIRRYLSKVADKLARLSIGMAPDTRFALRSPVIGEPLVLFQVPEGTTALEKVSKKYKDLLVTIEVGSFIAHADGKIVSQERSALEARIHSAELSGVERAYLLANLQWMLAVPPDLALFGQRVKDISGNDRHQLSQFALAMMVADGVIDPGEIEAVKRLYQDMGLAPDDVYSDLYAITVQTEPAPVRSDGKPDQSLGILSTPEHDSVVLDAKRIESVMANTASVSSILKNIFHNDEIDEEPGKTPEDAVENFPGLDAQHATFLRALLTRPHWDEAEFAALTEHFQLMPKGAVETLNEWSFERFGDVLIEEYKGYELNQDVVVELQKRETNDKDVRFPKTDVIVPG